LALPKNGPSRGRPGPESELRVLVINDTAIKC
jgi:hypothetical protein